MSFHDFVWRGDESGQLERTAQTRARRKAEGTTGTGADKRAQATGAGERGQTAADKRVPGAKAHAFAPGYSALLRAAATSRYFRDELAASCKEFKVSSTPAPLSQVASICS